MHRFNTIKIQEVLVGNGKISLKFVHKGKETRSTSFGKERGGGGEFTGPNFKTYYKTMSSARCINGQRTDTEQWKRTV